VATELIFLFEILFYHYL